MPADLKPITYLGTGYNYVNAASGPIYFNTNDHASAKTLPNLSNAEAHATTGDFRKLLFALSQDLYSKVKTVNDSAASADKLTKMAVTRTSSSQGGNFVFNYTWTFQLGATSFEVPNE